MKYLLGFISSAGKSKFKLWWQATSIKASNRNVWLLSAPIFCHQGRFPWLAFWRVNIHASSTVKPVGAEGVAEGLDWVGWCVVGMWGLSELIPKCLVRMPDVPLCSNTLVFLWVTFQEEALGKDRQKKTKSNTYIQSSTLFSTSFCWYASGCYFSALPRVTAFLIQFRFEENGALFFKQLSEVLLKTYTLSIKNKSLWPLGQDPLCLFHQACVSANPWHRQFPSWPQARAAGSHHPRTHPFNDPYQPSNLQRGAGAARSAWGWGRWQCLLSVSWHAPPLCLQPTAEPGAPLLLLNAHTSQGEQTGGCDTR